MSKIKKLLTVFVALIMCFALALFTACDTNDNNGKDNDDGKNDVTPPEESKEEKFLNAYAEQEILYAGVTYSMSGTENVSGEIVSSTVTEMTATGKLNLAAGNADLSTYKNITTTVGEDSKETEELSYIFLRDLDAYLYTVEADGEAPESFEGKTLAYLGNLGELLEGSSEEIPEGALDLISGKILGLIMGRGLTEAGVSVAKAAQYFGALTVEDGKATVDLNKLAYNAVKKLGDIINSIKAETTIGDLLANADLQQIVTPFVNMISAEEMQAYVASAIAAAYADEQISGVLQEKGVDLTPLLSVAPNANSTAYEYLVKLISSNELALVISKAMTANKLPPLLTTVDGLQVSMLFSMLSFATGKDITIDTIKAQYAEAVSGITEKKFAFGGLTVENAKIEYTLDGYAVTEQSLNMKVSLADGETEEAAEISVKLEYAQQAYELVDIEKCTIAGADDKTEDDIIALCV